MKKVNTGTAFTIMSFNTELDEFYDSVVVPALNDNGLTSKRVDRDHEGDLLPSEITRLIDEAEIIIADLTDERPNCYLEIGYAIGVDKRKHLVPTCRDDHAPFGDGPQKVHFDLASYPVIPWNQDRHDIVRDKLTKEVARRLNLVRRAPAANDPDTVWKWFDTEHAKAEPGLKRAWSDGGVGYAEFRFRVLGSREEFEISKLKRAATASRIENAGPWPMLFPPEPSDMKPTKFGIRCAWTRAERLHDHWALSKHGDLFMARTFFENTVDPLPHGARARPLHVETRIQEVAQASLLYPRLADALGISDETEIEFSVAYDDIGSRQLQMRNPHSMAHPFPSGPCEEDEVAARTQATIGSVRRNPATVAWPLIKPLFELFDDDLTEEVVRNEIVHYRSANGA